MKFLLLLILLLPLNYILAQEEPEKGRTEDGRAYRTDESGFQVVDYLAELEMTVEEQKRQILALQNELVAANKPKSAEPLAEKNLLTGEVRIAKAAAGSSESLKLQQELERLNLSLAEKDRKISELNSRVLSGQKDLLAIKALQTQAHSNQTEDSSCKHQQAEYDKLIATQKTEIAALQASLQKEQLVTVKVAEPVRQPVSIPVKSGVPEASRSKAFNILAENIRKDIELAYSFEKERQSLFKTYKANPKSGTLAFNLTPAKNSEGLTLENLPNMLSQSDSFADLSKVQKALLYITKAIKSDVELLRRLVK